MEAFNETYHVATTHPQFNKFGNFPRLGESAGQAQQHRLRRAQGSRRRPSRRSGSAPVPIRAISTAEMQLYTLEETNATTTKTLVDAAQRLVDELPEDAPPDQVLEHWLTSARSDDAARGVVWPTIDPEHLAKSGTAWQIFPNFQIGQGLTTALCYSARPQRLRPRQVHLRSGLLRAVPRKAKSRRPSGCTCRPDDPTGAACCRRTSPTWPPYSKA